MLNAYWTRFSSVFSQIFWHIWWFVKSDIKVRNWRKTLFLIWLQRPIYSKTRFSGTQVTQHYIPHSLKAHRLQKCRFAKEYCVTGMCAKKLAFSTTFCPQCDVSSIWLYVNDGWLRVLVNLWIWLLLSGL